MPVVRSIISAMTGHFGLRIGILENHQMDAAVRILG